MSRRSGAYGLVANGDEVVLRGGKIRESGCSGVYGHSGAKITVAKAEEGRPQTVSKDYGGGRGNSPDMPLNWNVTGYGGGDEDGEIIGIPQEMIGSTTNV